MPIPTMKGNMALLNSQTIAQATSSMHSQKVPREILAIVAPSGFFCHRIQLLSGQPARSGASAGFAGRVTGMATHGVRSGLLGP